MVSGPNFFLQLHKQPCKHYYLACIVMKRTEVLKISASSIMYIKLQCGLTRIPRFHILYLFCHLSFMMADIKHILHVSGMT